jgi:hypothetical protein
MPPYYFRYSSEVPKTSVGSMRGANLAYVNIEELDPSTELGNIRLIDFSHTFPENRLLSGNTVRIFSGNSTINDSANFLLTNIYSNTNDTTTLTPINKSEEVLPLWYKHDIGDEERIDRMPNGQYILRLEDNNGLVVDTNRYKTFFRSGSTEPAGIYTDLINTNNLYYILVYISSGVEVRKLLSVEIIFNKVESFSTTTANEYKVTYNASDTKYVIVTNGSNPAIIYSIKNEASTKIYAKHPVKVLSGEPWYLQIVNGSFKRSYTGWDYEYYIPEYTIQNWDPGFPSKKQLMETPEFVDNTLLRLRQTPLSLEASINPLRIYVRESSDRSDLLNTLINSTGAILDPNDTPFTDNSSSSHWWQVNITDIDQNSGLIKVSGLTPPVGLTVPTDLVITDNDMKVFTTDSLYAFYYYKELEYTYMALNLNPVLDRYITKGGFSIYIKPARAYVNGANYIASSVVNYIRFDDSEIITGGSDPSITTGITVDDFFAISDDSGVPEIGRDHKTFLELGRVFIRNTSTIRDITDGNIVDTRSRGGLLMDNLPTSVVNTINANTHGMYDLRYWDGEIMPGNSVVIFRLPSYLLNDNYEESGTPLTGTSLQSRYIDIREVCVKHLAAGVMPIIRFYDNATGEILINLKPPIDREWF